MSAAVCWCCRRARCRYCCGPRHYCRHLIGTACCRCHADALTAQAIDAANTRLRRTDE